MNFSFTPKTTGGFSLGTPTAAVTGFGSPIAPTATVISTATTTTAAIAPSGFSLLATPKTTTPTVPFGAAKPLTSSIAAPSLAGPAPSASTSGFSLPIATTSTPAVAYSLGATTTATGFSLAANTASTTPAATTTQSPAVGIISTTSTTAPAPALAPAPAPIAPIAATAVTTPLKPTTSTSSINFVQLEENINKWTIELEEQEKVFMNQVSHINNWDRVLLANGDKIVTLNNSVEKVKLEQQQLDHELDFIVAQQRELEECLIPLEKEFADITVSDPERDTTYRMAENLNTQLKQMSEDLKEVIEHINEKNKNQDTSDPIVQIGRILNAHMNSLQWVDQNTALIKQQLDQVTKLTEMHRRENDSTQNL